jgi:hypothetical protein
MPANQAGAAGAVKRQVFRTPSWAQGRRKKRKEATGDPEPDGKRGDDVRVGCLTIEYGRSALAQRPGVIASAAKQSSAREARKNKKRGIGRNLRASYLARLSARSWIASLRSQ